MTFIEKFEELRQKFDLSGGKTPSFHFAVEIDLTDADCGGAFYIACNDGVLAVEPYDYRDHTARVRISSADFADLIDGKVTAFDLAASDCAEVSGDFAHFNLLPTLKAKKRGGRPKKSEGDAQNAAKPKAKAAKQKK